MIIFFFLYLIILFLPGETIFQLSFFRKKEKILQYSIIEHLIYVIVLGLSVSSTVCLFLAIFQILNLILLIIIDLGIFLVGIVLNILNKENMNKYIVIFRIINYIKSKKAISVINIIKSNCLNIIFGIIFFFIYFLILVRYRYIPNHDIWYFTQWAIDIVKYSPNLLYSPETIDWYFGEILYTNFQNYYLAIFLLYNVELWHFIIKYILPFIPLICLFLFAINFLTNKKNQKKYLPILILFSSYFLMNWLFYCSPVIFSIIIGLLLVNSSFDINKRSYVLIIILVFYMYLFHSITTGLFVICFFFTLFFLFLSNLSNRETRKKYRNLLKKYRMLIIFTISVIAVIICIFISFFYSQILKFLTYRQQIILIDYNLRAIPPSIEDWLFANVGIHTLILSLLSIVIIFPMIRNKKIEFLKNIKIQNYKINVLLFFWILFIEMVIICLFFPIWYLLSRIPYLFYRYFIYLDLACIFLAPFSFWVIIKYIQTFKIEKRKIKLYTMSFKCFFIIFTIVLIWMHYNEKFNIREHYIYVPEEHISTYFWLRATSPSDSIYFASPYTKASTIYQHCILNDRIFINQSLGWVIFNDSLYSNGFDDNYNVTFREYIFIKNKPIDNRWASIPENYTDKKVDYIILDDHYNYYLINLLLQDTEFFELMDTIPYYDFIIWKNYTIHVFQTKTNNSDF